MLAVYTFIFSVVFKARWGDGGEESNTGFAVVMFVGMIVHGLFAEALIYNHDFAIALPIQGFCCPSA
jgi:ABC-type polysaccharide/polyol phosphate export permease